MDRQKCRRYREEWCRMGLLLILLLFLAQESARGMYQSVWGRKANKAEVLLQSGLASLAYRQKEESSASSWEQCFLSGCICLFPVIAYDRPGTAMLEGLKQENEQARQQEKEQEEAKAAVVVSPREETPVSVERLEDFEYLLSHFYTVDATTMIGAEQLNARELLGKNMRLHKQGQEPKVLIFHTHSQEAFQDSVAGDAGTTIVGMGAYLARLLQERYQIGTIHHGGVYDLIGGKLDRSRAYEQAEKRIRQILAEYPGIEVVIDLHRDGVAPDTHLVTDIDGKPTAQIMFFNGLSKTRAGGELTSLPNPYIQDNLAFSLQMKLACEKMYPGFARRIYLKGYRYNLHLKPKSLLIEAGAQTNTVEEMRNAMEPLAHVLASILADD